MQRKDIAVSNDLVKFSPKQIELIRDTIAVGATPDELDLFVAQCIRTGLDPFQRQVYAIKRYNSALRREAMTIQVSIDGLRLIAERTGVYAGQGPIEWCGSDGKWRDVWIDESPPSAARATVYRKDWAHPLVRVAHYKSFVAVTKEGKVTQFWARMPELMLGKCAEALALRAAFPQETSGLYIAEEMADSSQPRMVVESTGEIVEGSAAENPFLDEVDFNLNPPSKSTSTPVAAKKASVSKQAAEVQSSGVKLCPRCHAPAGKPHAKGCPNATVAVAEKPIQTVDTAAVEDDDAAEDEELDTYASILHNPDIELPSETLAIIKIIRDRDTNANAMTTDQHGYVVGLIDALYGNDEYKPHRYILSALAGRVVTHRHPLTYDCKVIIDWLKKKDEYPKELEGLDKLAEAVEGIYRDMEDV